jgi:hypothetical protein
MPRPATKTALLTAANERFDKMRKLIGDLTAAEQNAPFDFGDNIGKESHWERDNNLRDVLIHLYEWHMLLLNWVTANQNGENKPFLPAPYNWKTYPEMNAELWKKHQSTPYERSREMLKDSHDKAVALIEGFSDEELFEKKHFAWTGTTSLGSYCVSVTSSHYDWAMKKIKLHMKTAREGKEQ